MPGDAPVNKQVRCRSYGARVVLSDVVEGENREVTAARLAESLSREHGFTLLHPFEDHDVIAGQGTVAVELAEQATADLGVTHVDAFFVCAGGGGLAAGCCLALEESMPECKRYAVEPEAYDDHARSFAAGERLSVTGNPYSICDALQAASPGANTFPITSRLLTGVLTVSDDEVRHAMRVAFECLQLVLEPSGAVPLAAVLARKVSKRAKLCVLSVFFFCLFFGHDYQSGPSRVCFSPQHLITPHSLVSQSTAIYQRSITTTTSYTAGIITHPPHSITTIRICTPQPHSHAPTVSITHESLKFLPRSATIIKTVDLAKGGDSWEDHCGRGKRGQHRRCQVCHRTRLPCVHSTSWCQQERCSEGPHTAPTRCVRLDGV
jgi:cysteine synthase